MYVCICFLRLIGSFSSRPNWDPSGERVLSPFGSRGDTLACGRGGPNSDEGTDNVETSLIHYFTTHHDSDYFKFYVGQEAWTSSVTVTILLILQSNEHKITKIIKTMMIQTPPSTSHICRDPPCSQTCCIFELPPRSPRKENIIFNSMQNQDEILKGTRSQEDIKRYDKKSIDLGQNDAAGL